MSGDLRAGVVSFAPVGTSPLDVDAFEPIGHLDEAETVGLWTGPRPDDAFIPEFVRSFVASFRILTGELDRLWGAMIPLGEMILWAERQERRRKNRRRNRLRRKRTARRRRRG